jgi:hypothetical protein
VSASSLRHVGIIPTCARLTQYAREARRDYGELGSKDLTELKSFVKGLPKLLLLDRLSDLLVPVAEVGQRKDGVCGCVRACACVSAARMSAWVAG